MGLGDQRLAAPLGCGPIASARWACSPTRARRALGGKGGGGRWPGTRLRNGWNSPGCSRGVIPPHRQIRGIAAARYPVGTLGRRALEHPVPSVRGRRRFFFRAVSVMAGAPSGVSMERVPRLSAGSPVLRPPFPRLDQLFSRPPRVLATAPPGSSRDRPREQAMETTGRRTAGSSTRGDGVFTRKGRGIASGPPRGWVCESGTSSSWTWASAARGSSR